MACYNQTLDSWLANEFRVPFIFLVKPNLVRDIVGIKHKKSQVSTMAHGSLTTRQIEKPTPGKFVFFSITWCLL